MSSFALTLCDDVVVGIESFRLNNHIAANLHYLGMGRAARDVGAVYAAMSKASRAGHRDWFEASGAARYFRREGHELYLRDELYFNGNVDILDDDLCLAFRDRANERSLHIPVDARLLSRFGRLLPALRPTLPEESLRDACTDDEWAFVEQLVEADMIRRTPLVPVQPIAECQVRLVGHAFLALETPRTRVLFDPLCLLRTRRDVNELHELDRPIDAVVLSHPHWDHFNFDTLLHISRDTLMLVPKLVHPASLENVDMAGILEQLGFTRVESLAPWESRRVGEAVVTATPFHGEQSGPEVPQDWMTYHVAVGGRSFLGAVDTCHDSTRSMDDVMREVGRRLGPVDVLFSPFSGFHYPIAMFTRRPFYMGPGREQYSGGPDDAARWATILGATLLVPYACFAWTADDYERPEDDTHRGSLRRLRSIVKSWPRGPLVVLEAGAEGLKWDGRGGAIRCPEAGLAPEAVTK